MLELVLVLKLTPATWWCTRWLTDTDIIVTFQLDRSIVNVISKSCAFLATTCLNVCCEKGLLQWCWNWTFISVYSVWHFSGKTFFKLLVLISIQLFSVFISRDKIIIIFTFHHLHTTDCFHLLIISPHNCSFSTFVLPLRGCEDGCITSAEWSAHCFTTT